MDDNQSDITALISQGENLTLEFKSDKKCLPDRDLLAAIVALANTDAGYLLLGVEDDGTVTGLHPSHNNLLGLEAFIASRTNPPLSVKIVSEIVDGKKIAKIFVPAVSHLTSTSEGQLLRRRLMLNGRPEAVPFYPHEFIQRQSSLGLIDPSARVINELSVDDLNPMERHRIREIIRKYGGDQILLSLKDAELDGALGLTVTQNNKSCPTLAGLLLLGREEDLRRLLPAHEVAFQVLDHTEVRVNEFFRKPLLHIFEEVDQLFRARVTEQEFEVDLFRVPVPNYDRHAFREAFVNALVHRDYSRLGAVHVRMDENGLMISSPGGFVEGVTLQNILVVSPRSRNPLLADIIKRIGLAERTGRGIDRIYEGMLRYGRPVPDFSMSDSTVVTLFLSNVAPDFNFLEMIIQLEKQIGSALPIDSLIILSRLRTERRIDVVDLARHTQKSTQVTKAALEKLVELGLVEAHGVRQGRTYTLSASVYQKTGQKSAYVRQVGFNPIQQEQMVLNYINQHGSINRLEVMELCRITKDQAYHLLKKLKNNLLIKQQGIGKATTYVSKNG